MSWETATDFLPLPSFTMRNFWLSPWVGHRAVLSAIIRCAKTWNPGKPFDNELLKCHVIKVGLPTGLNIAFSRKEEVLLPGVEGLRLDLVKEQRITPLLDDVGADEEVPVAKCPLVDDHRIQGKQLIGPGKASS